jgi:Flp pilus assembly pilin Flp
MRTRRLAPVLARSTQRGAIECQRPRAGAAHETAKAGSAPRRWAADEAGSVCIEYVLIAVLVGLVATIAWIAAIGPALVSMWSDQRACLYDDICVSHSLP